LASLKGLAALTLGAARRPAPGCPTGARDLGPGKVIGWADLNVSVAIGHVLLRRLGRFRPLVTNRRCAAPRGLARPLVVPVASRTNGRRALRHLKSLPEEVRGRVGCTSLSPIAQLEPARKPLSTGRRMRSLLLMVSPSRRHAGSPRDDGGLRPRLRSVPAKLPRRCRASDDGGRPAPSDRSASI
jgi:hypothetical protein